MPDKVRGVSIEMKMRKFVKTMMFTDEGGGEVLFEANIGQLVALTLTDNTVLEVRGGNGTLRVNVDFVEIAGMVDGIRSGNASGSMLESASTSSKLTENKGGKT